MALTLKLLACTSLPSSTTPGTTTAISPTSASAKGWLIKNLTFLNTGGTGGQNVTIDLTLKQTTGGTARMLYKGLAANQAAAAISLIEREFTLNLNTPDILYATCVSTAGNPPVDCVVNGI